MDKWESIGDGEEIAMMLDDRARFIGLYHKHVAKDHGGECIGSIFFELEWVKSDPKYAGTPTWMIEQWEPLTVSPSLLCSCGHHGFIRNGRWITA
jgi:hypothetical protein